MPFADSGSVLAPTLHATFLPLLLAALCCGPLRIAAQYHLPTTMRLCTLFTLATSLFLVFPTPTLAGPIPPPILDLDASPSLLDSLIEDLNTPSTASTTENLFPEWTRPSSWLGFRVTNTHEADPTLPSSFQSEGHLVNSPIRGVITDESAKHRLGITARELDVLFAEKVLPRLEMVSSNPKFVSG